MRRYPISIHVHIDLVVMVPSLLEKSLGDVSEATDTTDNTKETPLSREFHLSLLLCGDVAFRLHEEHPDMEAYGTPIKFLRARYHGIHAFSVCCTGG